jgi:superoxide reductase
MVRELGNYIQTADWKSEKHVPAIEAPEEVKANELFDVMVSVGKDIAHPNTTEHHIRWISLYFYAEGDKFVHEVGTFEFSAHGESVEGANKGPVYTNHSIIAQLRIAKSGVLHAISYCNIHGLWQSSKTIKVV